MVVTCGLLASCVVVLACHCDVIVCMWVVGLALRALVSWWCDMHRQEEVLPEHGGTVALSQTNDGLAQWSNGWLVHLRGWEHKSISWPVPSHSRDQPLHCCRNKSSAMLGPTSQPTPLPPQLETSNYVSRRCQSKNCNAKPTLAPCTTHTPHCLRSATLLREQLIHHALSMKPTHTSATIGNLKLCEQKVPVKKLQC